VIDQTGVGTNPAGLALAEGKLFVGNTDYMGNYAGSSVSVIDLGSFEVTSTIPVNANPQYLLADEGCLHVSCGGNWADVMGSIQIIDIAQEIVTETIELGGYCGDLALSEEGIVYVADAMNTGIYAYNAQNWEVIYSPAAPFTPGGSVVEADQGFLAVLGGMWGENFTVNLYNLQEEHLADFQVALYGTDLKFLPEAAGELENELSEPEKVISYPNPFFEYVKFETTGSRELIKKIAVFDIRGRKVAETELNIWDGYDLYGKKLPSGIYLSRIYFQDGGEQVSKIIKIR
jgi:DNA-binding beta-propeller fold protein YncE